MIRRPPISTRTDTLFPYTTLFRHRCLFKHHLRGILAARDPGQRDEREQPKEPRNGAMGAKIVVERFHGYRYPAATRPRFKRAMRRSEERRVGTEWGSTCGSRGSTYIYKTNKYQKEKYNY